jgi:hypothetical protein
MSTISCEPVSTVYVGYDNAVTVVPYSDIAERTVYDMTTVTEVRASADLLTSVSQGDDITASSFDAPVTIWWEAVGTEWRIYLKVGLFVGIAAGEYKLRIILFDPPHANGLVLTDTVEVTVVAAP